MPFCVVSCIAVQADAIQSEPALRTDELLALTMLDMMCLLRHRHLTRQAVNKACALAVW
jgi:hypothetical protein